MIAKNTAHANCTHEATPTARKACRTTRQNAAEAATPVRGCDYCGGARISLDEGYNHADSDCPGFGSHLVLRTKEELLNVLLNMPARGYSIPSATLAKAGTMPHARLVQVIVRLMRKQG